MRVSNRVYLVGSEQFGLTHPLDCNCYLVDSGSARLLIDTGLGLGVDELLQNVRKAGFDPASIRHIVITHSHIGHWGGAEELRSRTGAQVWAPAGAEQGMRDVENDRAIKINFEFGRYPQNFVPRPCRPDKFFADGEDIPLDAIRLRAIHTAGHTLDSMCLLLEDEEHRALFTGDVLFYGGRLGITNLEGCSLDDYRRNIHKLAEINAEALFPGHGVFVLRRGQKHIERAVRKLRDLVLPESFFEENEFIWDREYLSSMVPEITKAAPN